MRFIFFLFPLLLFAKDIEIKIHSYLLNEEYFGTSKYITPISINNKTLFLGQGQTIFGDSLYLYKKFKNNNIEIKLGGFINRYYGDDKISNAQPIINITLKTENLKFSFGSLINSIRENLIDALYARELLYFIPIENGFLISQNFENFNYSANINWEQINSKKANEKLDVSLIANYKKLQLQGHYSHRGGQLYKNLQVLQSYSFNLNSYYSFNKFKFYVYLLVSAYLNKTYENRFKIGKGNILKIEYNNKYNLSFSTWIGDNFITAQGNPFYKAKHFQEFNINRNFKIDNLNIKTSFSIYKIPSKIEHKEKIELFYTFSI